MDEFDSLSHSTWECKYHVVFIPKCRRSVSGYEDSHYARIEIYYDRPETDDKMAARDAEERRRQEAQKAQ